MATKKYVSLDKLSLYDEKIKTLIDSKDSALEAKMTAYADGLSDNYDAAGSATTAKDEAVASAKSYTDTQVNALANGQVKTNTDAIAAIKDDENIDSFADVVAALANKQNTGDYVTKAEAQAMADAKDTAIAEAKSAADAAQADATSNAQAIATINNADTGILAKAKEYADDGDDAVQANVDVLSGKVGTVPEGQTVMSIITNIQENAYDDTEITERIDGIESEVDILIGSDASKSVRAISAEEVAKIVAGADESYDTLKEIADWISSHTTDAASMNSAIVALQNIVDGIGGEGESATVVTYVQSAIAALNIGDYAKAADLTALASKVSALETVSSTHATKTEVDTVSAALTEYKDAHASDYTNAQINAAIKDVADDVAALNDTYASDEELAAAIANEVTRADAAYAAKSLETIVAEHKADTVVHTTSTEKALWNAALQSSDIVTGTANGTIAVKGSDVAVKGLGSAAFTDSTAYDASGAAAAVDAKLTTENERAVAAETALGARIDEFVECSAEEINSLFTA